MQDITFNGLTSTLKGNLYSSPIIKKMAYAFPNSKGAVGTVPAEWLRNIPKNERKTFILNLYDVFSKISRIQREKVFFINRKCTKLLKSFFVENGVIKPNERLKFSSSGQGAFSYVLKFNVGNKKYAFKNFLKECYLDDIISEYGNCAEQNNAAFLNADEKSDWAKFYFGNVLDGYMVTKYIKLTSPFPSKKIELQRRGLEYLDYHSANSKLNIKFDYGGLRKLDDFPLDNKVACYIIGKIMDLPPNERTAEIEKIIADKKVPNYYDRMLGIEYIKKHEIPKETDGYTSTKDSVLLFIRKILFFLDK